MSVIEFNVMINSINRWSLVSS